MHSGLLLLLSHPLAVVQLRWFLHWHTQSSLQGTWWLLAYLIGSPFKHKGLPLLTAFASAACVLA